MSWVYTAKHEQVLPGDGEVSEVCIALVLIFMDSKLFFLMSLLLTEAPCSCCFYVGEESLEFHLSKQEV